MPGSPAADPAAGGAMGASDGESLIIGQYAGAADLAINQRSSSPFAYRP